ncbi:nuclear transport factor 2 family protein [Flavobacterium litorale]|uniref:Nuclear transport factor 2 family protein n=1 Tax=Flavobacterium litorale TaxID=2856519 RepID=A0ABX8V9K2_9FLAO|nr:nuclear transport factor 2 family protein [Flavobacterium litorale]
MCCITLVLNAQEDKAIERDIKATITTFFEGLHTADTLKIQLVCSDDIIIQSVIKPQGENQFKRIVTSKEMFYELINAIPKDAEIEERLLDYKIQVDGGMAHVWTPYEFYMRNELVHTGVNSFQLFKSNKGWKIIYLLDTRHKIELQ